MRSINRMIMLVALLAISTIAFGQTKGDKTLLKTEIMAEKLGLDAKQKAALDKQLKEAESERKARVEKLKALKEEMMRDAFVARQQREAELKEILTDEQWAAYVKMKEARKKQQRMKRRKPQRQGMQGFRRGPGKGKRPPLPRGEEQKGND